MLKTKWTLEEYNKYLEEPKTLCNPWRSVRLFDNPIIEAITMGPWYLTPICILPWVLYLLSLNSLSAMPTILWFCLGAISWTFAEYNLHRHLFHAEQSWLPDSPLFIAGHFVLNGIHHAFPQDAYRLVFPIIPAYFVVGLGVLPIPYYLLPEAIFPSFSAGLLYAYVLYECIHFFMHFGKTTSKFLNKWKKLHNWHHYRMGKLGFGVTL